MIFAESRHPLSSVAADERRVLGDLRELLARRGAEAEQLATLRQALADIDHLFLLVVAGEFNAGKSALINALLGEKVLAEGVTPTTAAVTLLSHGAQAEQVDRTDGLLELRHPLPLLRDLALVDTPGTNAILRHHETLTREFLPRADLLLFVTSADRPFTESERAFLEQIRAWGKKVVVVLNKIDVHSSPADVESQVQFIRESAQRLLGIDPPIWPISARLAMESRREDDAERQAALARASGFEPFRAYLEETLDDLGRLRLKLTSVLGVAERLADDQRRAIDTRLVVLNDDRETARRIERHLEQHADDQRKEFEYRLDRLDGLLRGLTERGQEFFADTIRLTRIFDLFNAEKVSADFERAVVADTPQRLEGLAEDLIDWLVDRDQRLWQWVTAEVQRRAETTPDLARSQLELPFAQDRRAVLQELLRATRDVLRRHDHRRQSEQLAASVREAVTRTTLVEAGALGLGAVTMAIVGSAAADITGILAAGALAGVGLYLLPLRRRRVEQQFRERTEQLRVALSDALRQEFENSLRTSLERIREALAPYDRFVVGELERLHEDSQELDRITRELQGLQQRIAAAAGSPTSIKPAGAGREQTQS